MATYKATYRRFNGSDWDVVHFQTNAGQVAETNTKRFLVPDTHKVNGYSFFDSNGAKGITLTDRDIKLYTDSSTTIEIALSNINTELNNKTTRVTNNTNNTLLGHVENDSGVVTIYSSDSTGAKERTNLIELNAQGVALKSLYGNEEEHVLTVSEDGVYIDSSAVLTRSDVDSSGSDFTSTTKVPTKKAVADYFASQNSASQKYVDDKISALVGTAPDALNTIQELAEAFNNNPDVIDTLQSTVAKKVDIASSNSTSSLFGNITNTNGEITLYSADNNTNDANGTKHLMSISNEGLFLGTLTGSLAEHRLEINDSGVLVDGSAVLTEVNKATTLANNGYLPTGAAILAYLSSNYVSSTSLTTQLANYATKAYVGEQIGTKATIYYSESSSEPSNPNTGDFWIATTGTVATA